MATKKKKSNKSRSKSTKKQDIIKIGGISIAKQKLIMVGGAVITVIILVWFVNSSFWPWPSSAEIGRRLNDIIDACMYNERSRGCSSIQEKYHMTFEYCHSLADIPEIGKNIPVYGVAKKENLEAREIGYRGGDKTLNKYPYYNCAGRLDDIDKNNYPNLLSSEPSTMVLFALYKTPHYSTSGDSYQCDVYLDPDYNFLWEQIPNIENIKNEVQIISNTYKGISCSRLSELQDVFDRVNTKLSSYSGDRTVQQFYKNYGDWVGDREKDDQLHVTCNFMGRSFVSGACGATTVVNATNTLESFSNEMRSYVSTDEFTSKILITD